MTESDALSAAADRLERTAARQMSRDGVEGPASTWGWRTIARALYAEADALREAVGTTPQGRWDRWEKS